jgi:hypothetical protein
MPVMGSSLDFRVEIVQVGEMRRSVARVGVEEDVCEVGLREGMEMVTVMSGAVWRDIVLFVLGWWS